MYWKWSLYQFAPFKNHKNDILAIRDVKFLEASFLFAFISSRKNTIFSWTIFFITHTAWVSLATTVKDFFKKAKKTFSKWDHSETINIFIASLAFIKAIVLLVFSLNFAFSVENINIYRISGTFSSITRRVGFFKQRKTVRCFRKIFLTIFFRPTNKKLGFILWNNVSNKIKSK